MSNTASVAFMMTGAQERRLLALGYITDEIYRMKPARAHEILAEFDAPDPTQSLEFRLDDVAALNPDPRPAPPTQGDIQQFFTIMQRGVNGYVLVQNLSAGTDGQQRMSYWFKTGTPIKVDPHIIATGNIFFGINAAVEIVTDADRLKYIGKTDAQIAPHVGTKNSTIAALNALHREYDGKDFTDPTLAEIDAQLPIVKAGDDQRVAQAIALDPNSKVRPASDQALHNQAAGAAKDAKFKTNQVYYLSLAKAQVDALTPAPSVIVASGGGYQCYWLLAEPLIIRTHPDEPNAHIQSYAADLQKRWVQLDPKADQGVNDIRRIYRVPGTYNHKKKYAPNFPLVSFYRKAFDLRYCLDGLKTLLPAFVPIVTQQPTQAHAAHQAHHNEPYEGDSVIAAYNAKHNLAGMLVSYGYTHAGNNRYMRPGGTDSPGVELFPTENNARIWSSNDPLYSGEHRSTPFTVFCVYEHNGDVRKAVAVAAIELGMVRQAKAESISTQLQKCRVWLQTADFAAFIPEALQSAIGYRTNATDKRLYSALLDVLGQYGSLRGPISNQQLALASGLSEGSVRNAMQRLMGACLIAKIDPVDQKNESGCFWYELRSLDYILSCVDCAALAFPTDTPAAQSTQLTKTEIFTTYKTHDAFQRGGSKRQRQAATIKALGPDALLLLDVVKDFGRQTQGDVAMRTHQSKFTVSRLVKRLDAHDIITVEAEGTRRFVSLNSDWLEIVNELTPQMPTYGMAFKRKLNAAVRTVEYCDLKTARNMGNAEKIAKQREKAAKQAFDLMTSETLANFSTERQAEIKERMRKHFALQNGAAMFVNQVDKLPETSDFIAFMRSEPKAPWLETYDNGRMARIAQQLEENEMLIDARRAMLYEDLGIKAGAA